MSAFGNIRKHVPIEHNGKHYIATVPLNDIMATTVSPYGNMSLNIPATDEILRMVQHWLASDTWGKRRVATTRKTRFLEDYAA